MNSVKITFQSHPKWLRHIRKIVREICVLAGYKPKEVDHLVLAVDEACTNIIRHSYKGRTTGSITLECQSDPKKLQFVLRDKGCTVDCEKIRSRCLDEVRPGGLGIFFIQRMMDKVVYGRSRGMNFLRLTKYAKKK
jgi:anti-sigma regulatory factor (Ser/Thr protein kinase)